MQYWDLVDRVRAFPTRFTEIDVNQVCCAIHRPVECGVPGASGCRGLPYGNHRSIRSVYEGTVPVCHAEIGARVLDRRAYRSVVNSTTPFLHSAFQRSMSFRKKYMAGAAIDWKTYGAGYCYLSPIEPTARSRVARCLGPLPLLADALRFMIAFGDSSSKYTIVELRPGVYHVEPNGMVPFPRMLAILVETIEQYPNAVVGSDQLPEEIGSVAPRVCPDSFMGCMPSIEIDLLASAKVYEQYAAGREQQVQAWLLDRGLNLDANDIKQIVLVTCAASSVPGGGLEQIRRFSRNMALLGDTVIKVFHASHVVSSFGVPKDYSVLSELASNATLARVFQDSGLRACSSVSGLAITSKANADIMEAVIGIIASRVPAFILRDFLRSLGLLLPRTNFVLETIPEEHVVLALNSRQLARALELAKEGKLDG